jgi:hypothetical protein
MSLIRVALGVLAGMVAASCGGGGQGGPRGLEDVTVLREGRQVALPVRLPPGLEEIVAVTGNGLPLVSFYSTGEPLVTVCTGGVGACRAATRSERTLQLVPLGATTAVLTVDPAEEPSRPRLSDELAAFWSSVALTHAAPEWLPKATP